MPAPTAPGVIRGVVRYEDGTPCAGLPLVAEPEIDGLFGTMNNQSDPPSDRLTRFRGYVAELHAHSLSASSGADGAFELRGAGDDGYHLYSNDRSQPLTERPVKCKAGDVLDVVVGRVAHLEFDVKLDTGEELKYASLMIAGNGPARSVHWSRGRAVETEVGNLTISTEHQRLPFTYRGRVEVEVPPAGLEKPIELLLDAETLNALIIRANLPKPYYQDFGAHLIPVEAMADGWPRDVMDLSRRGYSSWGNNFFPQVHKVDPGKYVIIGVIHPVEIVLRHEVYYAGGTQEFEIELPEPKREDHILLRVLDALGKPVTNSTVNYTNRAMAPNSSSPAAIINRGNGEYWLRHMPAELWSSRPAEEYIVTVSHRTLGRRVVPVPVGSREDIEVRFGPDSKLILLLDNLPADVSILQLSALMRGDNPGAERTFDDPQKPPPKVQARNEFSLPPGRVRVSLKAKEPALGHFVVSLYEREVELGPEPMELRFTLPTLHELRFMVPEGFKDNVTLSSVEPQWSVLGGRPNEQGRLVFRNLPPGEYYVTTRSGRMNVRVPCEDVELALKPFNGYRIRRIDQDGLMPKHGLGQGDVLREINGEALTFTPYWSALKSRVPEGELTIRFQREGRWQTVTLTTETWQTFKNVWYEPLCIDD
jgi:hypothetical protein